MLEFSILRTSRTRVGENLTYRGGDPRALVTIAYVAILVKHERGTFLFDTGLGDRVDQQYARDMPVWKRPLLRYGAVDSARSQLERAGFGAVERIVLSHGHWDHASGLVDFPEAEVWTTPGEREFLFAYRPPWSLQRGAVMPSQIADPAIKWKLFEFIDGPYGGFEASLDLFGDRSAVLVPLPGHTPGSTGLFLTTTSGRRVLFCGDAVWNSGAIACRAAHAVRKPHRRRRPARGATRGRTVASHRSRRSRAYDRARSRWRLARTAGTFPILDFVRCRAAAGRHEIKLQMRDPVIIASGMCIALFSHRDQEPAVPYERTNDGCRLRPTPRASTTTSSSHFCDRRIGPLSGAVNGSMNRSAIHFASDCSRAKGLSGSLAS